MGDARGQREVEGGFGPPVRVVALGFLLFGFLVVLWAGHPGFGFGVILGFGPCEWPLTMMSCVYYTLVTRSLESPAIASASGYETR